MTRGEDLRHRLVSGTGHDEQVRLRARLEPLEAAVAEELELDRLLNLEIDLLGQAVIGLLEDPDRPV